MATIFVGTHRMEFGVALPSRRNLLWANVLLY
jgi:hypothetical protein